MTLWPHVCVASRRRSHRPCRRSCRKVRRSPRRHRRRPLTPSRRRVHRSRARRRQRRRPPLTPGPVQGRRCLRPPSRLAPRPRAPLRTVCYRQVSLPTKPRPHPGQIETLRKLAPRPQRRQIWRRPKNSRPLPSRRAAHRWSRRCRHRPRPIPRSTRPTASTTMRRRPTHRLPCTRPCRRCRRCRRRWTNWTAHSRRSRPSRTRSRSTRGTI